MKSQIYKLELSYWEILLYCIKEFEDRSAYKGRMIKECVFS